MPGAEAGRRRSFSTPIHQIAGYGSSWQSAPVKHRDDLLLLQLHGDLAFLGCIRTPDACCTSGSQRAGPGLRLWQLCGSLAARPFHGAGPALTNPAAPAHPAPTAWLKLCCRRWDVVVGALLLFLAAEKQCRGRRVVVRASSWAPRCRSRLWVAASSEHCCCCRRPDSSRPAAEAVRPAARRPPRRPRHPRMRPRPGTPRAPPARRADYPALR